MAYYFLEITLSKQNRTSPAELRERTEPPDDAGFIFIPRELAIGCQLSRLRSQVFGYQAS